MFNKKDFVTEDSLREHLAGTNKFITREIHRQDTIRPMIMLQIKLR